MQNWRIDSDLFSAKLLLFVVVLSTLKANYKAIIFFIYILTLTNINFTFSVIDICIIFDTFLISDEPVGHEGRRLPYLAQEKFSYIANYLEQTRDIDVHSVSTEDDSGKPGSSSAPSEFAEFEETNGMTLP